MNDRNEMKLQLTLEILRRAAVGAWESPETRLAIMVAVNDLADGLAAWDGDMALPDDFKVRSGTQIVVRASGGDYAMTFASLANTNGTSTGARQCVTIDLGERRASLWRITSEFELVSPTAGNTVDISGSFSDTTGAGKANTSGTDAAYTGYSNNINDAVKQLEFLHAHTCTSQGTGTTQKPGPSVFSAKARYLNLVAVNRSGSAFVGNDTNQRIVLTPIEESIDD